MAKLTKISVMATLLALFAFAAKPETAEAVGPAGGPVRDPGAHAVTLGSDPPRDDARLLPVSGIHFAQIRVRERLERCSFRHFEGDCLVDGHRLIHSAASGLTRRNSS